MRLVLDTNIVASGLLWDGTPARLIDAAQAGAIEIYTSRILLAELTRILKRAKFAKVIAASGVGIEGLVLGYAELATLVTRADSANDYCRPGRRPCAGLRACRRCRVDRLGRQTPDWAGRI